MRIISRSALVRFWTAHPAARLPLAQWHDLTRRANWKNFPEVKRSFGQTDQAKVASGQTVCIFDIGGNKFRLIAFVAYPKQKVYVLRVLTHREYDRKAWVKQL